MLYTCRFFCWSVFFHGVCVFGVSGYFLSSLGRFEF
jgi:hypothetical protein